MTRLGRLVLAGFVLALIARVLWVAHTPDYKPIWDARAYEARGLYLFKFHHLRRFGPVVREGLRRVRLHKPDAYWPPLYVIFQATCDQLHQWSWTAGLRIGRIQFTRLVQAVTGAAGAALLTACSARLFGHRLARVVAVVAAIYPATVYVNESFYAESLWGPLLIAAVWAMVEYRYTARWRWALLSGLFTALGTLTHSDGVYFLLPAAIALWPRGAVSLRAGRVSLRRFGGPAAFAAAFVATMLPWEIRNYVQFHTVVLVSTSLGVTLAGTYNDRARLSKRKPAQWVHPNHLAYYRSAWSNKFQLQPALESKLVHRALRYIVAHPLYPFDVFYWNTVRLLELAGTTAAFRTAVEVGVTHAQSDVMVYCFWALAALAIVGACSRYVRVGVAWLWAVPLVMWVGTVLLTGEAPRFRAGIDPFLVILASAGILLIWDRRPRLRVEYANT